MLAYNSTLCNRNLELHCSDGRELVTSSYDEALAFLLQPCGEFAVTYNIDALVDNICSIMPKPLGDKVRKGGQIFTPENRKLYYQAGRLFGINHINIYGLSKYADEPINDCQKLLELGNKVIDAYRTFGIEPTKLTSPVAVYGELFDKIEFPRACDLPDSAFPLLQECAETQSREWRDVFTLGHFEANEVADYDLSGAYPSIMAHLPDLNHCMFFTSKTMPGYGDYTWGLLTGKLKITKPVSPFICDKHKCYGIGEWDDQITTDQYWLLKKYDIGDFQMEHGNFFSIPPTHFKNSYPFLDIMQNLYFARDNPNELVSKIAKGIAVGIGGKFAQRNSDGSLGENFNSIYAKMTTSRCMVKVASFIYHNHLENNLVSVLVDGCMVEKAIVRPTRKGMGEWRLNPPLPALVLSLEYQWQGQKHPSYHTYEDMMRLIKEHPNRASYEGVDINLISYDRHFEKLPKTGGELLSQRYHSRPYVIKPELR